MSAPAYDASGRSVKGWIGVDLDATLAHYERWIPGGGVGRPVPAMVARVRAWRAQGIEVRIVTAHACSAVDPDVRASLVEKIVAWCVEHIGEPLPVTSEKDFAMIELWDDRCVSVEPNTGRAFRCGAEELDGPA